MKKIVVINLGGTSSKISVYESEQVLGQKTIRHSQEELVELVTNQQQVDYRVNLIRVWLKELGINMIDVDAIAVRGGNIPADLSYKGGTYAIKGKLKDVIMSGYDSSSLFYHGVVIGVPVALELSGEQDIPIFVTDPPTVNELQPVAKIAGHPDFERIPVFHALNQRAVARKVASEIGKTYEDSRLVVTHLGAGISVGVHQGGKVIDVNNVTRGDGPMAPNRAGQLPMSQLIEAVYLSNLSLEEAQLKLRVGGGVKAYLGTDDMRQVERMIEEGNDYAKLIWEALVYQVAKEIGSCVAVLDGEVDALIFTGGMAHSKALMDALITKVRRFGPIKILAGEFENEGLALGALRILSGSEKPVHVTITDE